MGTKTTKTIHVRARYQVYYTDLLERLKRPQASTDGAASHTMKKKMKKHQR
jgi:hypothetical protein